jgi:hypothetical protein
MSSVTNGPRSQVTAAGQKRNWTRIVIAAVVVLVAIWFVQGFVLNGVLPLCSSCSLW